jgi:hypothetical protein
VGAAGGDSREVSATDLQHCDWCGAGNMDDVMGLGVGSCAEDEACSWIKSTAQLWRDDNAGVLELVRYVGCLPLTIGLVSAHARVHGTASLDEFLAPLKRAVPPPA